MRKILIISNEDEPGVNYVTKEMERIKIPFLKIDSDGLFENNSLQIKMSLNDKEKETYIKFKGDEVNIDEVISVWYRRPELPKPKTEKGISDPESFIADEWRSTLWSFYTTSPSYWMNTPLWGIHLLEHNKMYQMGMAKKAGLNVPNSIVTNSYNDLLKFCDEQNGVIACKVVRSRLFQDESKTFGIFTQKFLKSDLVTKRHNIEKCPLMAQEYIKKSLELRITIIGHHVLTCAIYSQDSLRTMDDWRRYDFENVRHTKFDLPVEIHNKLLSFMSLCNLNFGAIDMILTPSGNYYFLEVNPSGQFGWIESLTGLPIANTIATSLNEPENNGLRIQTI